jgi:hypothetical protein
MKTRIAPVLLVIAAAAYGQTAPYSVPYSADEASVRTRTLADGTQVSEKTIEGHLYRDSAGRSRSERTIAPDSENRTVIVEIVDPAAGVRYSLDAKEKVAYRSPLAPAAAKRRAPEASADAAAPQQQAGLESLGMRMIGGVLAEGRRIVTTLLPAADSNDRLTVVTTEMWFSNTLGVILSSKVSDPRAGETAYSITNVVQAEPDAQLFQVPADYQVVDAASSN